MKEGVRSIGVVGDATRDRRLRTHGFFPQALAGSKELVHSRWGVRRKLKAFPDRPVPDGEPTLGGNASNYALGRSKLGADTVIMMSTVGRGAADFIADSLKDNGVVPILKKHYRVQPEGNVVVNGQERNRAIISLKPLGWLPQTVPLADVKPDEIFLSSVGGSNWARRYDAVANYAADNGVFLAVSPGTVQMKYKGPALYRAIQKANALLINREEALKLLGRQKTDKLPMEQLLDQVQALGKDSMIVLITDEDKGSYAKDSEGKKYHANAQLIPEEEVGSLLGAGDGYAAAFLQAISEGKSIPDAMIWGTLNASSIIRTTDAHSGQLTRKEMLALVDGKHDVVVEELSQTKLRAAEDVFQA